MFGEVNNNIPINVEALETLQVSCNGAGLAVAMDEDNEQLREKSKTDKEKKQGSTRATSNTSAVLIYVLKTILIGRGSRHALY